MVTHSSTSRDGRESNSRPSSRESSAQPLHCQATVWDCCWCVRVLVGTALQLQQEDDHGVVVCTSSSGFTLRRLSVWMCDPLVRLKTLAALVDVCSGKWRNHFYFTPGRVQSMTICLSACIFQRLRVQSLWNFLNRLTVAVAWSSDNDSAILDDIIFAHSHPGKGDTSKAYPESHSPGCSSRGKVWCLWLPCLLWVFFVTILLIVMFVNEKDTRAKENSCSFMRITSLYLEKN